MAEAPDTPRAPNDLTAADPASTARTDAPPSRTRLGRWWRNRQRWQRRTIVAVPIAVLLYTLGGFFVVPLALRHIVVPQIGKRLTGTISLRAAQCNPYTFFLGLDGLEIRDSADRKAIAFERFETNFELWRSLFKPGLHFQHVRIDQPFIGLHVAADGTANLAQLVKPDPDPEPTEPLEQIPHFVIDDFKLHEGAVSVDDLSLPEPFNTVIGGVAITLTTIDTSPEHTNTTNLVCTTETGARIQWDGTFKLNPFSSKGTIVASQLYMPRFMPYAMRLLTARVVEGRLDFTLEYDFEPVHEPRLALFRFPTIVADELKVRHEDDSLLTLPRLELEAISIDATTRSLKGTAIRLRDGSLLARRNEEGQLNLAAIVALPADGTTSPEPAPTADAAVAGPARPERVDPADIQFPVQQLLTALSYLFEDAIGPWTVDVDELVIDNQAVDVVDEDVSPPVRIPLRRTLLRAGPISSENGFLVPFEATTTIFDSGQITAKGAMGVLDRTLETTIRADDIELVSGAPYLALILSPPLDVPSMQSGRAFLDLRLKADATDPEETRIELAGPIRLEAAEIVRAEDGVPLVSSRSTTLDSTITLSTHPGGGVAGTWSGTFTAQDVNGGEHLMRALGIGDGGVTMTSVQMDGKSAAGRQGDASGSFEWDGTVAIDGLDGDGLAISGPTDVASGAIRLSGRATAERQADGRTTVAWSGTVGSSEGHLFSRTTNIDARVGDVLLDGTATATILDDANQRVEWTGTLTARAAAADLAGTTRASFTALETKGSLVTVLAPGDVNVEWRGALSSQDATVSGADWSTEAGSLAVDGMATVDGGGAEAIRWEGTADLGVIAARSAMGGGIEALGERLRVDGTLTSSSDTLEDASWTGLVELGRPQVKASAAGSPATIEADLLRIDGSTTLDQGGPGVLEHVGTVDVAAATVRAEQLASGLGSTVRSLRLDGTLRVDPLLEAPRVSWQGQIAGADAGLDLGSGPVALSLARIDAKGTAGLEPGPSGGLTWDGTVGLGSVGGSVAGSQLVIGGAEAAGALTSGLDDGSTIDWKGTVAATDARTVDGTRSIGASRVSHDGAAQVRRGSSPDLTASGAVTIEGGQAAFDAATLDVPSVLAQGIDLQHAAGTLSIGSVAVEAPVLAADVARTPVSEADDGAAAPARDASAGHAKTPITPAARGEALAAMLPYRVALGTFTLSDGRIELADASAQPPSKSMIDQIDVRAANVATDGTAMSELSAKARIQGSGQFDAKGSANIFENPPSGDVTVTLSHVPLPPYSPLSGRFAGFMIDGGRLDVTLPVNVDAGKVKGQLDFLMDKLKLGAKVKSPDAPNIPIDLGLALLRDPNDQIKGSVPFSGDMSSPEFSFGGLIWQAVLSLLGKIVTAPFQLIAGAFAGGQDLDLSFIAFEPGSAELNGEALSKLDVLAQGLNERPQITLAASGRFAREADIAAMRPNLLREEARKRLQSSFPNIKDVPDDVYRQIVISKHAELPPDRQAPRLPNGDAPPFDQVERTVLGTMEVTDQMLRDLAQQRAQAIKLMLTTEKGVAPERVTANVPEGAEAESDAPQAAMQIGS